MKPDLIKLPAAVTVKLLDTSAEQPLECDILLPDYCPDIVRVLTCRARADVTNRTVNETTLTVEGMTTVTLCYLGEVGGVRKTTVRQPFSKSFEMPAAPIAPIVFASAERSALGCRAISRRKADVRGAIAIKVLLYDTFTQEAVSGTREPTLCLLTEENENECLTENTPVRFSLREEVSPEEGTIKISDIIRTDCCVDLSEWRGVSGGILVKGEIFLSVLSSDDAGELSHKNYSLPLNRVLEAKAPERVKYVQVRCAYAECSPPEEENSRISVELWLEAEIISSQRQQITTVRDAFSTKYAHEITEKVYPSLVAESEIRESISVSADAAMPDGGAEIKDICATVSAFSCAEDNGKLTLTGRVNFACLISGEEGNIEALSASAPFERAVMTLKDGNYNFPVQAEIMSCGAIKSDEGVSFTAQVLITGLVLKNTERSAVSDITVDEGSPRETDESVGLIIRYAESGERVWDIASHYGIEPERLMRDNALETDALQEKTVLIISSPQSQSSMN